MEDTAIPWWNLVLISRRYGQCEPLYGENPTSTGPGVNVRGISHAVEKLWKKEI